jgi:predicted DNA-binding transcriptional regulator AlpA
MKTYCRYNFIRTYQLATKDVAMQYLRAKQLAEMFSVNLSTIWRWRQREGFPPHIQLGSNTVVWTKSSIEQWIEEKQVKTC